MEAGKRVRSTSSARPKVRVGGGARFSSQSAHLALTHPRKVDLSAGLFAQVERVEVIGIVVPAQNLEVDVPVCVHRDKTSACRVDSSEPEHRVTFTPPREDELLTDNRLPRHELQGALLRILGEDRSLPSELLHSVVHLVQDGIARRRLGDPRLGADGEDREQGESSEAARPRRVGPRGVRARQRRVAGQSLHRLGVREREPHEEAAVDSRDKSHRIGDGGAHKLAHPAIDWE